MERRNLSPLSVEAQRRPNDQIHVESLSDGSSNLDRTDHLDGSEEHIRVENNKDSEEDDGDGRGNYFRYPELDNITEKPG